jgi:heme/copper-type cytochrome/quinol oxidase subunit 2
VSEQRPTHATAAQDAASDQQAQDTPITVFAAHALLVVDVLAFLVTLVFVPLAQKVGEQCAADAPAAQHAAANQQAQDAALVISTTLTLTLFVTHLFVFVLASFTQKMGEQQATQPVASQHATGDEQLQDAMLLLAGLIALFVEMLLTRFLAPLTQEVGEKQAPHSPAARGRSEQERPVLLFKQVQIHDILLSCWGLHL